MGKSIVAVRALGGTRLHLRFQDGAEGEVNLAEMVPLRGVFGALADPAVFGQVSINADIGTVCWPNGADLAPYVLYSRITGAPLPGQSR
jgi:hypothetical protein